MHTITHTPFFSSCRFIMPNLDEEKEESPTPPQSPRVRRRLVSAHPPIPHSSMPRVSSYTDPSFIAPSPAPPSPAPPSPAPLAMPLSRQSEMIRRLSSTERTIGRLSAGEEERERRLQVVEGEQSLGMTNLHASVEGLERSSQWLIQQVSELQARSTTGISSDSSRHSTSRASLYSHHGVSVFDTPSAASTYGWPSTASTYGWPSTAYTQEFLPGGFLRDLMDTPILVHTVLWDASRARSDFMLLFSIVRRQAALAQLMELITNMDPEQARRQDQRAQAEAQTRVPVACFLAGRYGSEWAEHALTLVVALLIFLLLRASLPFGRRCSQMPPRILSADDKLLADSFHIRSRLSPCLHLPLNTATQYHYSNCLAFG